jgi:two-component system sensor histidine kinase BaeS
MRSLVFKLTLAFLLIGLTGAVMVSVLLQVRTRTAFDQFRLDQEQQTVVTQLVQYYEDHKGWEGVTDVFQPGPSPDNHRGSPRFTLVGADLTVLFGGPRERLGQAVPESSLKGAIPLNVDNQTVGWLIQPPAPAQIVPNSPENAFLDNVNQAALISGLIAIFLALTLGGFLAFTLTRSLHELTLASNEIAQGNLGHQVKVRSKDEIGVLASAFNKMSLDLAQATHTRRQMTADIAHDLRTPLSVITGYTEALSDGKLPGTPEIYEILHDETRHLNKLIDDLRTLSLADVGELPLNLEINDPRALLERVSTRHTLAANQKGVELRVSSGPDLPEIEIDSERMSQVLDNLVANAMRYTPAGGTIELGAQAGAQAVSLSVRDTGSGISAEDLPYIFDRFYRVDAARQQTGESGLGLAIARSIVEAHGGSIRAVSVLTEGTTFTITLPLPAEQAAA